MIFLIDSGHGGMVNGRYVTSPNKMYKHSDTEIFYEGVYNRLIKEMLFARLRDKGIKYIDICPTHEDISLTTRASYANLIAKEYGYGTSLLISLHSNAGGGKGFEIYTSPGQNRSDNFAIEFVKIFKKCFPEIGLRMDLTDQDPDKEEKFYMLTAPLCPSILPEFLFYDNYNDYKLLMDSDIQKRYADMLSQFCFYCDNNVII